MDFGQFATVGMLIPADALLEAFALLEGQSDSVFLVAHAEHYIGLSDTDWIPPLDTGIKKAPVSGAVNRS